MTDHKDEWTCGHVAGAMCAECYRELASRAAELAAENEQLRERITELEQTLKEQIQAG